MPNLMDYEQYGGVGFAYYLLAVVREFWSARSTQLAFAVVGTLSVLATLVRAVLFVWGFIRPSTLQAYCHAETGSWALVTGANDGIGRGFAEELLSAGFNVLLHGRNKQKLERVRSELAASNPRRTVDFVVADASQDRAEKAVVDKVKQLPGKLVILVNNVGGVTTLPQYLALAAIPEADIDTQININARFPVQLTRALLPTLMQNKPALILNCGSAAGYLGVPYIATYTATKAFLHTFSRALKDEFAAEGLRGAGRGPPDLDCMGFVIGNVRSARNKTEMPFFTIDARHCARGCLARVGSGEVLAYANWRQAVQMEVMGLLPQSVLRKTMIDEMKERKRAEERELKKV